MDVGEGVPRRQEEAGSPSLSGIPPLPSETALMQELPWGRVALMEHVTDGCEMDVTHNPSWVLTPGSPMCMVT